MRASDAKLATALREIGLEEMAKRAEQSEWNDYFSPHDLPQHALIGELGGKIDTPEAHALIKRVINGDFDGTKEESDEWALSGEGQDAMSRLVGERKGFATPTEDPGPTGEKVVQGGRLAFRVETGPAGDMWVAYFAASDKDDDNIWMGSVAMGVVQNPQRKEMFMALMRHAVEEFFDRQGMPVESWGDTIKRKRE